MGTAASIYGDDLIRPINYAIPWGYDSYHGAYHAAFTTGSTGASQDVASDIGDVGHNMYVFNSGGAVQIQVAADSSTYGASIIVQASQTVTFNGLRIGTYTPTHLGTDTVLNIIVW